MAFFIGKTLLSNKCVSLAVSRIIKRVGYSKTILGHHVRANNSRILVDLFVVFDRRKRESHRHRETTHSQFPHIFAVLPALLGCTSDEDNLNNEENSSSVSHTSKSRTETPTINRHNKRKLNGRFAKTSGKYKVVEPMIAASAARRLLFENNDELNDENEPPSKRQTRSETVLYYIIFKFVYSTS